MMPWRQLLDVGYGADQATDFFLLKPKDRQKLRARISLSDLMKIQAYVNECKDEISGLAEVKLLTGGGFEIVQPIILDQQVTGASTDLTEAAAQFLMEIVGKGQSPAAYKFWWHSHVDMGAFWSDTDEGTARGFHNVFMISMVINRAGEFLLRLDQFEPFPLTIYNIPLRVIIPTDKALTASCREEIEAKVHSPIYTTGRKILGRGFKAMGQFLDRISGPEPLEPGEPGQNYGQDESPVRPENLNIGREQTSPPPPPIAVPLRLAKPPIAMVKTKPKTEDKPKPRVEDEEEEQDDSKTKK